MSNKLADPTQTRTTPRWAVALQGEPFDLEDARRLFEHDPKTRVCSIPCTGGDSIALVADEFKKLTDSSEVMGAAEQILERLNGILFVKDVKALKLGAVHQQGVNGKWDNRTIFAAGFASGRARVVGHITVHGGQDPASRPPPPDHAVWMQESMSDDVVAELLKYLSGEPGWVEIYKAHELMKKDIEMSLGKRNWQAMGWPAESVIKKLTEDAQAVRHSSAGPGIRKKATRMSLPEARALMQNLAGIWLAWRYPPTFVSKV
jgi:hypothetical protein